MLIYWDYILIVIGGDYLAGRGVLGKGYGGYCRSQTSGMSLGQTQLILSGGHTHMAVPAGEHTSLPRSALPLLRITVSIPPNNP